MRSGSNVQLATLRNRDLELQTTSAFSNHGSVERSTACCRPKNVLHVWIFQKFPFLGHLVLHHLRMTKLNNNAVYVFKYLYSLKMGKDINQNM
jgi:hypothetical protein